MKENFNSQVILRSSFKLGNLYDEIDVILFQFPKK